MKASVLVTAFILAASQCVSAGLITYGDKDLLGTGSYPVDPVTNATLEGLAPAVTTFGAPAVSHSFGFDPSIGEFPGTDQIYVGSNQTGSHDGYSSYAGRIAGPQTLVLDYSSIVPANETITTFTLGIGADDFQNPVFGQPFEARINGVVDPALTAFLNSLDQTTPVAQFFSIGLAPSQLTSNNTLTLEIDQLGDGGDGWAVDFLTAGVTTEAVPEPASAALLLCGAVVCLRRRRR